MTLSTSPDAGCTARVPSLVSAAWSQLAAQRSPASIFLTPEWMAVARRHDPNEQITLSTGEPEFAIASLSRSPDGTVRFAGGELTDEQDVVAAPEGCRTGAAAIARWIAAERAPRVLLEYVPGDTPTLDAFTDVLRTNGYAVTREKMVASPRIALASDFETYVQGLGKKERPSCAASSVASRPRRARRSAGPQSTSFPRYSIGSSRCTVFPVERRRHS